MNPTLQRAVTSFYNLIYEAQTFATTMSRIDTGEQEHYSGRIEGLNWVLDRCQELEDMDANLTPLPFSGCSQRSSRISITNCQSSVEKRDVGQMAGRKPSTLLPIICRA